MTARPEGAPPILLHHLKHNKVLHEQVVLLTVSIARRADGRSKASRSRSQTLGDGFWRVVARFGFMESPDVPVALARARAEGAALDDDDTTYYLADLTLFGRTAGSA